MSKTVLVVEDEESVRNLTANFLTSLGWSVTTASSGEEAIAILKKKLFKVMLTDLDLGGLKTGFDVLAEAGKRSPQTMSVVISGRVDIFEDDLKLMGASHVLSKPFNADRLKQLLDTV